MTSTSTTTASYPTSVSTPSTPTANELRLEDLQNRVNWANYANMMRNLGFQIIRLKSDGTFDFSTAPVSSGTSSGSKSN